MFECFEILYISSKVWGQNSARGGNVRMDCRYTGKYLFFLSMEYQTALKLSKNQLISLLSELGNKKHLINGYSCVIATSQSRADMRWTERREDMRWRTPRQNWLTLTRLGSYVNTSTDKKYTKLSSSWNVPLVITLRKCYISIMQDHVQGDRQSQATSYTRM